ncbi:MAG: hypothetical protein Q9174_001683 [Haloplaca sp. 1 TL-2023]
MDQFPVFNDGDVEILLSSSPEDRLVLHSVNLRLFSDFFRSSLSDRWPPGEDTEEETIKWRFKLLFDRENEAFLRKKTKNDGSPSEVTSSEVAEIFLAYRINEVTYGSTWVATQGHRTVIGTYHQYFGTLYHMPLQTANGIAFVQALRQLSSLVNLGDFLGGLRPLVTPVKAFISSDIISLRHFAISEAPTLLTIARKLELSELFKDVVCMVAGDHSTEDWKILSEFDHKISSLILKKRSSLRIMIEEINEKLLSLDLGIPQREYNADVMRSVQEGLEQLVDRSRAGPWAKYAELYVKLVDREFVHRLVWENGIIRERLCVQVRAIISPLLRNLVSPLWNREPTMYRRHPSLLCVACEDEDLPWKT